MRDRNNNQLDKSMLNIPWMLTVNHQTWSAYPNFNLKNLRMIHNVSSYFSFVKKINSNRYDPKATPIQIGRRDLPAGVMKEDFSHLQICYKSWESVEIHLLQIIYRN